MKLLNNTSDSNFITEDEHQKHIIKKYEFRNIDKKLEAQIAPSMEESGIYTPSEETQEIKGLDILQEQLGRLTEENQKVFQKLSFLQEQLQNAQNYEANLVEELKKTSYDQGYMQAKQEGQEELEKELDSQKEKIIFSIENLDKSAKKFQEEIERITQDLSTIALDLAKEVIIKEVEEGSAKIALAIANELLAPLMGDTEILLKANPLDLPYLQEKISSSKITFEADPLIAKGGVIISSPKGNFDGSILSRYRNLKRTILDEKGL